METIWGGYSKAPSAGLVQQFGIEGTLPKSNTSIKSKAEMEVLDARESRLYKRWLEFCCKTEAIEIMVDYLDNEKQMIILDCMMEGMSYRSIANHSSLNRNKVRELKEAMLCQICQNALA